MLSAVRWAAPALVSLLAAGCAMEGAPAGPRIAFAEDFAGFLGWESYRLPADTLTDGHLSSPNRFVYVDRPIPDMPEPFPLGTIVVKTLEEGPRQDWEIHAMVKRGGGYNAHGSEGWEFFALAFDEDDELFVTWRGTGDDDVAYIDPITGEAQACNSCHVIGAERDYVFSREGL